MSNDESATEQQPRESLHQLRSAHGSLFHLLRSSAFGRVCPGKRHRRPGSSHSVRDRYISCSFVRPPVHVDNRRGVIANERMSTLLLTGLSVFNRFRGLSLFSLQKESNVETENE